MMFLIAAGNGWKSKMKALEMISENMIGKDFDCLVQRVIYAYKCKFPSFIPFESEIATAEEQAELNAFFYHVICYLYDNPDLISPYEPDDYLEDGVMRKMKSELVAKMKLIEKKLIAFYQLLFDIGKVSKIENGQFSIARDAIKFSRDKQKKLCQLGIQMKTDADLVHLTSEQFPHCFSAWKLLVDICTVRCEQDNKEMLWFRFMNAIFNPAAISESSVFGKLLDEPEHLDKLEHLLLDLGYGYSYKDGRLRIVKEYPHKQLGYLSIEVAYRRKEQLIIEFHLPGFSNLLHSYEQIDSDLQTFIFSRLKDCDACGYCTQTDKSGKKKKRAQLLLCNGEARLKCSLYPRFSCHALNCEMTDSMITLFTMAEKN